MKWKVRNNVVSELFVDDENIILPWGVETADSSAFFSLEDGFGYRYKVLEETKEITERSYYAKMKVKMKEGAWNLLVKEEMDSNVIRRRIEALTIEDSVFMDFVMRFRFKEDVFNSACIAGRIITHNNSNIYHQYPVSEVRLNGNKYSVIIKVEDSIVPDGFSPVMYVRDSKGEWVVHVRMFPKTWDTEVIKLCSGFMGTQPLPNWIAKMLLKIPYVRESLWYRGERAPYKNRLYRKLLNPSAFAMVDVKKGERLMWAVTMEFV